MRDEKVGRIVEMVNRGNPVRMEDIQWVLDENTRLAAEVERLREAAETSIRKCEQYWNEHNIPDAEVHVALELIHGELRKALKGER